MNEVKGPATEAIGLALSGGGLRAAAFHAGALKYLAEQRFLDKVVHVSSVSGGSLFAGLVFQQGDYRWPGYDEYLREAFPNIRQTLTTQSLQSSAILRLALNPLNWRFILSRANVLAQAIDGLWGIKVPLSALHGVPVWSINCTTGETGRRYRFKNGTMGDYELGHAAVEGFSVAKAMAISAAFPGGIGPLTLKVKEFHWKKRKEWNASDLEPYQPPFSHLHLYDGGLYDNLGLEPMFDVGQQSLKEDKTLPSNLTYLLVSDGGAPLVREGIPHPLNPWRFKRIADIALDQSRALRVRAFVNFLIKNPTLGAYAGIGAVAMPSIKKFSQGREQISAKLIHENWLSANEVRQAATYSTTLGQLPAATFDLIARHGYETTKWNMEMMSQPQNPSIDVIKKNEYRA